MTLPIPLGSTYGWPVKSFDLPRAAFTPLDAKELEAFSKLKEHIADVTAQQPRGFDMVVNALFGTTQEDTTLRLHAFLVATVEIDKRDLYARCAGAIENTIITVELPTLKPGAPL